jgi:outer membrane protein assembly factor BamB
MKYLIIALSALLIVGAACNKTFSDDSPLEPTYKPSVLMATANGVLYSLDASTGAKNWEYIPTALAGQAFNYTPAINSNDECFFGAGFYVFGVNTKTGKAVTGFPKVFNRAISASIYTDDGQMYIPASDSLYCTDYTGAIKWRRLLRGIKSSPFKQNGCLYVVSNDAAAAQALIYCLNPADGSLIKSTTNNPDPRYDNPAKFVSPFFPVPAVSSFSGVKGNGTYLYACSGVSGSPAGTLNCFNDSLRRQTPGTASTLSNVWQYYIPNGAVYSTPIVKGDMCVVGSYDYKIHCVDGTSGEATSRWTYPTAERVSGSAMLDLNNENAIIGSNDFNLYAINYVTGQLRWKYPTSSLIKSSPAIYNNRLYFTSLDKFIYCIDASTGKLVWKNNINITPAAGASVTELASPIITEYNGKHFLPSVLGNSNL